METSPAGEEEGLGDLLFFVRIRGRSFARIRIDDLDEAAFLLTALMHQPRALGDLLSEDRELALRTRLLNGLIPDREVTIRPTIAAIENASVTRLFLAHLAFLAGWAGDPESDRSSVLTVRIIAAGQEFSELT